MTYLERYEAGQYVEVWKELSELGEAVRGTAVIADATAVARATMERVATNVNRLVERLLAQGFEFGVYPDGTRVPTTPTAIASPDATSLADLEELESLAGAVPLSLKMFWQVVGGVSLIGRTRGGWPQYSDPLCVVSPRAGIVDFRDYGATQVHGAARETFLCPIAPDVLHKDNVSGGAPYSIGLPNTRADGLVHDEWHGVDFVPYLRMAILDWGGFPGLSRASPQEKWRSQAPSHVAPEWLEELTLDLVPF